MGTGTHPTWTLDGEGRRKKGEPAGCRDRKDNTRLKTASMELKKSRIKSLALNDKEVI